MSKHKGFTLAEMLTTIAIIGLIAAFTIPSLVQDSINKETVVALRKYQLILSDALMKYSADNGCIGDLSACDAFVGELDTPAAWDELKSYFTLAKDCGMTNGEGCFAKGVSYKRLNGSDYGVVDTWPRAKSVLGDGASLFVYDYEGNCNKDISRRNSGPMFYICGIAGVDINGQNGPNQIGRDLFFFFITKKGVVPYGNFDDGWFSTVDGDPECDPSGEDAQDGYGAGCTARVLAEGAVNY